MQAGRASSTAEHNTLFRALETLRPAGQARFEDPLARAFLTWPLAPVADLARIGPIHRLVVGVIDRRWPGVRPSVVARTRWIDRCLDGVLDGKIEQVVILGAGYDSRPYRLERLKGRSIFEVDHPDTQAQKRTRLERAGITPRRDVRFVATDFTLGSLDGVMAAAGYRESLPTVFLWEGVTNYLTEEAVDGTLRWCAQAAVGSHVIFTYIHRDALTHPERYHAATRVFATVRRTGEAMTFGMLPEALPAYLAERGLRLEDDAGAATYRTRYYGEKADGIHGHEFYRIAHATVRR